MTSRIRTAALCLTMLVACKSKAEETRLTSTEICRKAIEFELSDSGVLDLCVADLEARRAKLSSEAWRSFSSCVEAITTANTEDLEDMRACLSILAPPSAVAVGGVPIEQANPPIWQACEHLAEVRVDEERRFADWDTRGRRQAVRREAFDCLTVLSVEQSTRSKTSFEALLECMKRGSNSTQIERCF